MYLMQAKAPDESKSAWDLVKLIATVPGTEAFRTGHIRGSLHVPFEDLPARFAAPDPEARRALILVDETDERSHLAFELLTGRGFSWVYVMKGGMNAWRGRGMPVEK